MPTLTKLYSLQEAAQHNTKDDCWVVIHGKVYDVTKYLDDHPGGDDVLLEAIGRDSGEDFEDAGHSKSARELMEDYFIGEIDPSAAIPELEISRKDQQPSNFTQKFMSVTAQYWTVPAAVIGISVMVAALFYSRKN